MPAFKLEDGYKATLGLPEEFIKKNKNDAAGTATENGGPWAG